MAGFEQVTELQIIQHLFNSYRKIYKIDLKENVVKTMGPYDLVESQAQLIDKLEKRREFARGRGQLVADAMMVYKGITLLAQKSTFNKNN